MFLISLDSYLMQHSVPKAGTWGPPGTHSRKPGVARQVRGGVVWWRWEQVSGWVEGAALHIKGGQGRQQAVQPAGEGGSGSQAQELTPYLAGPSRLDSPGRDEAVGWWELGRRRHILTAQARVGRGAHGHLPSL